MRKLFVKATVLAGSVFASFGAQAVTVLAPDSTVAGHSIGYWTGQWWNWVAGQNEPNAFETAGNAGASANQSGPVWFLAGTFAGGSVTRTFDVPGDKYILVPLINIEESVIEPNGLFPNKKNTPGKVNQYVNANFSSMDPGALQLVINGAPFAGDLSKYSETYRSTVDKFELNYANPNFSYPDGSVTGWSGYSFAKGYYVMLDPLGSEGVTITYGGATKDGAFTTEVTAIINGGGPSTFDLAAGANAVSTVPEPATWTMMLLGLGGLGLAAARASGKNATCA